jgi:hypothetical protein
VLGGGGGGNDGDQLGIDRSICGDGDLSVNRLRRCMMSNGSYVLPSGRKVSLCRFYLDYTYDGCLEGTPETVSPTILKCLPKNVHDLLPPGEPLVIHEPGVVPLPPIRLVAELESSGVNASDDFEIYSRLFVCWFVDRMDKGIDDLVQPILQALDWEGHAKNYSIMDF